MRGDRKFLAVSVLVILIFIGLVAGCGGVHVDQIGQYKIDVQQITVDQGAPVTCIVLRADHGASLSCDWPK